MELTNIETEVNAVLTEFLILTADIKAKTKRLEEIKKWCKDRGTFSTSKFVCSVNLRTRTGLAGLEIVIDAIGKQILEDNDLIRTSEFLLVTVSKKETIIVKEPEYEFE